MWHSGHSKETAGQLAGVLHPSGNGHRRCNALCLRYIGAQGYGEDKERMKAWPTAKASKAEISASLSQHLYLRGLPPHALLNSNSAPMIGYKAKAGAPDTA